MKKKRWFIGGGVLLGLCVWAGWFGLTVNHVTVESDKIETPIRLALVTDLHSTFYGEGQEKLLAVLEKEQPQAILLAGDIADDEVPHAGTEALLAAIGEKYPCYYVSGNHEYWSGEFEKIEEMIASYGVTVLHGEGQWLELEGESIWIAGVDDPDGFVKKEQWEEQLGTVMAEREEQAADAFSILLSHRPEKTAQYESSGFDLVTAGHAHGGQIRIPWIMNGLFAPNQGWLPKYAGGVYDLGETTMVVSRGLCRNSLPRIWNPPEVVIIEIT